MDGWIEYASVQPRHHSISPSDLFRPESPDIPSHTHICLGRQIDNDKPRGTQQRLVDGLFSRRRNDCKHEVDDAVCRVMRADDLGEQERGFHG